MKILYTELNSEFEKRYNEFLSISNETKGHIIKANYNVKKQ